MISGVQTAKIFLHPRQCSRTVPVEVLWKGYIGELDGEYRLSESKLALSFVDIFAVYPLTADFPEFEVRYYSTSPGRLQGSRRAWHEAPCDTVFL